MSKKLLTIAQVLALPEGEWANGDIFAVLTNPKPPRGKGPWTATLTDSTGSIVGKFWGGGIDHWSGKRVKLSGAGMQRKAYQNVPELSVGQKADVSFAGAPGTAAQEEDAIPGDPLPSEPRYDVTPHGIVPRVSDAPKAAGLPVHGATVGMCVKGALDIWLQTRANAGDVWDSNAISFVYGVSNQILGVCQRVEKHANEESQDDVPF